MRKFWIKSENLNENQYNHKSMKNWNTEMQLI